MSGDEPAESEDGAAEEVADRLRYAPDLVDHDRVLEVFAASGPAGRATIAGAIGAASPADAARLSEAVPLLVETLAGDTERGTRQLLEALARIAEGDPAAVRSVADTLVEYLTAYNIWENRAATEAFRHVVTAYPEEIERIGPLLDHDQQRIEGRAASVLASATERDATLAADFLQDCVRLVEHNSLAREPATVVLANAGWLDPAALDPAVERLIAVVRDNGEGRRDDDSGRDAHESDRRRAGERSSESADDRLHRGGESSERAGEHRDGPDREPRDARHESPDEADDGAPRRAALEALRHVAGHDPGTVQSIVPLCVELTTDDDEDLAASAARLLTTLLLQEPSTRVGEFAGPASYFDRMALVEALADASTGLPGRELLFSDFLDDESQFIRYEVYRQLGPLD